MAYETVTYETRGHVGILALNRPEKLNAISAELRRDVRAVFDLVRDDDEIRVLILTGVGRGFCSGADLTGTPAAPVTGQNQMLDEMSWVGEWGQMFHDFDKPLIGAINGVCAGAGMSAAMGCDVRIGGPGARFKTTFAERNLSPDSGLSWFLPRVIGYAAAADLIFTSRMVEAPEALSLGLLNRLVEGDLLDAAVAYAEQMAQWPPVAIRSSKRVLQHSQEATLEQSLRYEIVGLSVSRRAVNDAKESIASFREKRKGVYSGT